MTEVQVLDLRGLPPEQQAAAIRAKYRQCRGSGATVRAHVDDLPARLYISLLESGYRVTLQREGAETVLVLKTDGEPRANYSGAHSIVSHPGTAECTLLPARTGWRS